MAKNKFCYAGLFAHVLFNLTSLSAHSMEYTKEIDKDYILRSMGYLQVTNSRGDISVQGWALDKIRVKWIKRVFSDDPRQAGILLSAVDYGYEVTEKGIEISAQYGKGLPILERLREQEQPSSVMDLTVYAPANLKLKLWTVSGRLNLKSWNENAQLRSGSGNIRVDGMTANALDLTCAACSVQLKNIRASVHALGLSGSFEMNHVWGKSIFAETGSGSIKLHRIQGDQLYITQSGSIDGQVLSGKIEFSSQQGHVNLTEISGFLSGTALSGNIIAKVKDWNFSDQAVIESGRGNVELTLPRRFSADVDIWSLHGNAQVYFPVERVQSQATVGPEPANRQVGRIRDGGELLKIFSETGNIFVFKDKL